MSDTAWVTLIGFVTLLAGYVWADYKARRDRSWDREDRKVDAATLAAKTEEEARKLEAKMDTHNRDALARSITVQELIHDNTQKSVDAFAEASMAIKVANGMNEKLMAVTQAIQAVRPTTIIVDRRAPPRDDA